jgi:hypothetical protein
LAVLILFFQLVPNQEIQSSSNQNFPEWSIGDNISVFNVIINPYQKNLSKQNPEINLSPANNFYDKYDIQSIPDMTNSKKIYGGGFSHLHRYSTFLTVFFSTST